MQKLKNLLKNTILNVQNINVNKKKNAKQKEAGVMNAAMFAWT